MSYALRYYGPGGAEVINVYDDEETARYARTYFASHGFSVGFPYPVADDRPECECESILAYEGPDSPYDICEAHGLDFEGAVE